jgi:transcriptional regulator with PAS, ATPase and Fis domain
MNERKSLLYYLEQIKSALDKNDFARAKRLGELALKKIYLLSHTPYEEYLLCCRLGFTYRNLYEFSRSLDTFYRAYLTATKHHLKPADIAFVHLQMAHSLIAINAFNQALNKLQKVEQYYMKYGETVFPMDKNQHFFSFILDAYCQLHKNDFGNVRKIIDEKFVSYLSDSPDDFLVMDCYHLKGEYFMAIKDYNHSREFFQDGIKICEKISFIDGILEAKIHLATMELLEGRLESAITILQNIFDDAKRLKLNELICESSLFLSKCYSLKNMPDKAAAVERRIKPLINKLDVVWLYETTKEFDKLFRKLPSKDNLTNQADYIPHILIRTMNHRYKSTAYKEFIIGNSSIMKEIWLNIGKIAPTDLPVLIQGETGTGKELIAHAIHQNSPRLDRPCLDFNCSAIPETLIESQLFGHTKGAFTGAIEDKKGYVELANGGTLFVDELANMSPSMQQKLLRVMEEKIIWPVGAEKPVAVDSRFVFATNQNIEDMVKQKLFREDLFYRINTIVITLPPLRDRKDDILLLIQHFLGKYSPKTQDAQRLTPGALSLLTAYPWPGNVRELENEIQRICVLYPDVKTITELMLSETIRNCNLAPSVVSKGKTGLKKALEDVCTAFDHLGHFASEIG